MVRVECGPYPINIVKFKAFCEPTPEGVLRALVTAEWHTKRHKDIYRLAHHDFLAAYFEDGQLIFEVETDKYVQDDDGTVRDQQLTPVWF